MSKKPIKLDPADKLIVGEVGPWASEKHGRLRRYIQASHGARAKFLPPVGTGGASYIELYSGAGRSFIKDTGQIIDGSALAAYKAAHASGHRFSELHLSDREKQNSDALSQRIRALGGAATSYFGDAATVVDRVVSAINPRDLHLAFLDPFNLAQLPFSIIKDFDEFKAGSLHVGMGCVPYAMNALVPRAFGIVLDRPAVLTG